MSDKCPYCNADLSEEFSKQANELKNAFQESSVSEGDDNVFYVDYDRMGQEYAVLRIVFKYEFEQWQVVEMNICTQDFDIAIKCPQKLFKDPWSAFDNAKKYLDKNVED